MQFKYNEIRQLKEKWDEIESAIQDKSELVFETLNFGGFICPGFWFTTGNDGQVYVNQNCCDGYDGESSPNCHITYPFSWLNESLENISNLIHTEREMVTWDKGTGR